VAECQGDQIRLISPYWANFPLLGDYLLLKIAEVAQKYVLGLILKIKNMVGYVLGDFYRNQSGYPAECSLLKK
jgi:hypothetical protein